MPRRVGLLLLVVGFVAAVVGFASGCGSLFSYSGRHPVAAYTLAPGIPFRQAVAAKAGARYTLAVQVEFEREGLASANGALVVLAKFPLVASIEAAKAVGWLDPNEPPTVLYGQSLRQSGGPPRAGAAALVAERLVGPYLCPFDQDIALAVDLGPDRLGSAHVKEAHVVVYDDALPTTVKLAFAAAALGLAFLASGTTMLVLGPVGARRRRVRRRPTG